MKKKLISLMISSCIALPAIAAEDALLSNIIVSLNTNQIASVSEFINDYSITSKHTYSHVFKGFSATVPSSMLEQLNNDQRVLSVSADGNVHATKSNSSEIAACSFLFGCQTEQQQRPWGVSRIGANTAENTGEGVHVYVIDTGIDSDHDDLARNISNGYSVEMCLGLDCANSWDDDQGHGTHVAGTIGALDNNLDVIGVAPAVTLHAVKVLNAAGSGSNSGVIAGIDWVAQQAASLGVPVVANMSLGGSGTKTGTCTNNGFVGNDNFHRAICNAKNQGVIFAVAAGNDGENANQATPAAYDDAVITVSATNINDDWASFSNWGNGAANWTNHQSAPVVIAAPGVDILSTKSGGGTTTMSGTSMAAPHVAGVLALYLETISLNPDGSAFTETRDWLLNNSESNANLTNSTGDAHQEDFLNAKIPR
ncbi:S8 family serine peptidase [Colwellia sp. BRX10-3]|uniref:S8 family serine peptidase n=1 Tax=Colwellia sp. BRX10-3 TaxID=2759844 RepID=UPI0015F73F63|nr:S8 family serine peptidase [Colwellia sp. BRX10-3]MBA6391621.1 S8 family serine peptidase [Colwellia sp. BRX10-3]